jgi:hypothetical protein
LGPGSLPRAAAQQAPPDNEGQAGGERAGEDEEATPDPAATQLVLEEQTAWVRPGVEFAARLSLPAGHGGALVEGRLYPAVEDTAGVTATARGEELGRPLHRLAEITVAAGQPDVVVRMVVGPVEGGADLDPGVYPLVVEAATEEGDPPDPLVLHVVVVGADQIGRRPVGIVTPVDQPFRWTPDARLELAGGADELAARLTRLVEQPGIPHTLLPTPGMVATLADGADGARALAALRELARRGQVVNGPFAHLPAGSWTAAQLDAALVEQFAAGEAALTAGFGGPPTGAAWLVSPTDTPGLLRWLAARGVSTFLVPDPAEAAAPADDDAEGSGAEDADDGAADEDDPGGDEATRPDIPFRITDIDRPHVALPVERVRADAAQDAAAGGIPDGGPVALAHRVLAGLAVVAVAGGSQAPPPAVLLVEDLDLPEGAAGTAATGLEGATAALLAGLAQPGPLSPVPVAALDPGRADRYPVELENWDLPAPAASDLGGLATRLAEARAQLDSFVATVGPSDPMVGRLQSAVLALGAQDLQTGERAAVLVAMGELVRSQLGTVVLDRDQPVTVTAHRADLPLAIHNRGTRPLDVAVRIESSDLEVVGPAVRLLRLGPNATTDVAVPVRVNRSGDFRVSVEVTSPDGRVALAERTLTVRSTAISGVGVVLSIGALVFLFVWWGRHVRRTRRARAPVAAPAPPEPRRVSEPVP